MALHEELKQIRLDAGVSLADISHMTKIRTELLEKIEAGDFSVVPTPYLRAFLREYAEVVGIDPEIVIEVFEKKRQGIRTARAEQTVVSVPPPSPVSETGEEQISDGESLEKTAPDESAAETAEDSSPEKASENIPEKITGSDVEEETDTGIVKEKDEPAEETVPGQSDEKTTDTQESPVTTPGKAANPLDSETEQLPLFTGRTDESQSAAGTQETAPKQVPLIDKDTAETVTSPDRSKRLDLQEPDSGGKFFFILFLLLLIIASAVIVWMNRSGMF